jgi:hypothetical protein
MRLLGKRLTDEQRAEELFSPYLDGQVTAEERRFLDRYLADHPGAREKYSLLKAAVQMTQALPQVKAPRSFVLPRSMARKPKLSLRLYPAMRLATVAAMALFVFALVGDLVSSSIPAQPQANMLISAKSAEPPAATEPAVGESAPAAAPTMTPAAPPTLAPAPAGAAASTEAADSVEAPPAPAAELAAPTSEPEASRRAGLAPTAEAEADQSALALADSAESPEVAPEAAPISILRLAAIVLAVLAVMLAAATLYLRRRAL